MFLKEQNKEMLNQPVVGNSVPTGLSRSQEAIFCFESSVTTVCEQPWVPRLHPGTNLTQDVLSHLDGQLRVQRIMARSCSFSSKRGQSPGRTTLLEAEDKSTSVIMGVSLIFLIKRKFELWNHGSPSPSLRTYIRGYWSDGRFKSLKGQRIFAKIA